jgi:hypothetical protein
MTILLSTLNARYTHAGLGLHYLLAHMGDLQDVTRLHELALGAMTAGIVEKLPAHKLRIVGCGAYISGMWKKAAATRRFDEQSTPNAYGILWSLL